MPRNGGYLYATTDANGNKIGINTDEISAVLGVASHDVVTLGISDKVNKWNKNKPYRRTTSEVPSRTVDNANNGVNGTGKYCGNRGSGTTTGFPCFWGMRYPMNTAQQNQSGSGRNNLLELCFDTIYVPTQKHPNYEYMKPVADTDFCSEDDFDGYYHNAAAFLDAGVAGANTGTNESTMTINKFDDSKLKVYAIIPSDSNGFEFKDLIAEAESYYLVAEFYKTGMWTDKSNASPGKVVKSSVSLGAASGMSISFEVPVSEILSALGLSTTADVQFYVCVGFNKYTGTTAAGSAAFIAPWSFRNNKHATLVTVQQGSPYTVSFTKYAWAGSSTYNNFTSTAISAQSDTMKFQASVYNGGSSAMKIYGPGNAQTGGLAFRARAIGSYGAYHDHNGGHLSEGGDDFNGAWRALKVATNSDMSSNVNNVTINSKETKTLYFQADNLLPYGYTTGIVVEVSNDGGSTWATTGLHTCNFNRLNA